ncbi:MAG: hypothetical protein V5A68_06460 [Candidatus Thermoplasmatota archaeon]
MKKYVTITVPREIGKEELEDIRDMKKKLEGKHDLDIEVIIEEGKHRG